MNLPNGRPRCLQSTLKSDDEHSQPPRSAARVTWLTAEISASNLSRGNRVFRNALHVMPLLALALTLAACGVAAPQVASPTMPATVPQAALTQTPPSHVIATPALVTVTPIPTSVTTPVTSSSRSETVTITEPSLVPTARPIPPHPGTELSQIYEKGSSGRKEIALTFDAGADRGNGEAILDRLAEYEVVASFGVTGQWAEANPDLIHRMVAEGHTVFNHTWSHQSWTGRSTSADPEDPSTWEPLSREERLAELTKTQEAIRAIASYDMRPYWRPAYGDYDVDALADAAEVGYTATVMWSCESFAWKGWTAEQIVPYCTTNMAPDDIILLHVGAQGADHDALPGLIEGLRGQGFTFVTIEQILQP